MPTSAQGAAANVRALLSRDVQSLTTINGLPPLRLGSYLEQFDSGLTHLQKDLGTLGTRAGGPDQLNSPAGPTGFPGGSSRPRILRHHERRPED